MAVVNSSNVITSNTNIVNYTEVDSGDKSISFDIPESLAVGDSLIIYGLVNIEVGGSIDIDITATSAIISEQVISAEETTMEGWPIYNMGERLAQHILDTQFPFYSEYLATVDDVYNIAGDKYLTEDQRRFLIYLSGLNIRGEGLSDPNTPLIMNWEKWFQSASSMLNIGYTFETIDDFLRVRVENYAFFFQDSETIDFSDRINAFDIETESMPELAFQKLKSGYKSFDYESIAGRGEYNTNNQRTTIANTDKEFNNVSEVRGDTKEISDLINSPIANGGSTDEKSDNEIFVIKTQRNTTDPTVDWDSEQEENITVENNTSIFGSTGLNLFITPTRMLIRQANRIKAAFTKHLSTYLRFQTADKNQTLETTGEGYTVIENDDILMNDLEDPLYIPKKHTVTLDLDWDDIATIQAAPLGYIRLTSTLTGFLLNLKKKNNTNEAVIQIIERYVSS